MGFDIEGLRRAATNLSGKTYELNMLKSALLSYRESISAAWSGAECNAVCTAIDAIVQKINLTSQQIADGAYKMNAAATKQQINEAEERADKEMASI